MSRGIRQLCVYLYKQYSQYSSTNEYQTPADSILNLWGLAIEDIIEENYLSADLTASQFGYRLVEFRDTTSTNTGTFYILEKTQASINHWDFYIQSEC